MLFSIWKILKLFIEIIFNSVISVFKDELLVSVRQQKKVI